MKVWVWVMSLFNDMTIRQFMRVMDEVLGALDLNW